MSVKYLLSRQTDPEVLFARIQELENRNNRITNQLQRMTQHFYQYSNCEYWDRIDEDLIQESFKLLKTV